MYSPPVLVLTQYVFCLCDYTAINSNYGAAKIKKECNLSLNLPNCICIINVILASNHS